MAATRDPLDFDTARTTVFDSVLQGVKTRYPVENEVVRLELHDVAYDGPETIGLAEQKDAVLRRKTLARPLRGTWRLVNKADNAVLDEHKATIARVPYLTQRGTYLLNGNEYSVANQIRLRSGVYTRKKDNGELEAHLNVLKGGPSFRMYMEPETGLFKVNVGQSQLRAYPLLRSIGVTDEQMRSEWGNALHAVNAAKGVEQPVLQKLWDRFASPRALKALGKTEQERDFKALLGNMQLDPEVTGFTLGQPYDRVSPEVLLRTTGKLLRISRGEEDSDDRDSLAYQETWGPEDLFQERILKDSGGTTARLLWKATLNKNLKGVRPGILDEQLNQVFFGSGLASHLEEINPLDAVDQALRITRTGEGGLSDAIPAESRAVQPTHFQYIDPVRTSESLNIGVDTRLALNVRKGSDRALYTKVKDLKTGSEIEVPPQVMARAVVAFPGGVERARRDGDTRVIAFKRGSLELVDVDEVQYEAPSVQSMMNFHSLLIPMTGAAAGNRALMGGKFLSQAMALREGEAPWVQTATPDGAGTFEEKAGSFVGAVRARQPGVVTRILPDRIEVRQADGQTVPYELYNNFPLNRKSYVHSTPAVQPGQAVVPGAVLARSNYTDDKGRLAVGKNLRVGYMQHSDSVYEDSVLVSESAARKLTSERMYTSKVDSDPHTEVSRPKFIATHPNIFTSAQMKAVDDSGVVRAGTIVKYGDPLILALKQSTPRGAGQVHRAHGGTWRDASVRWEHDIDGEVTDVWQDGSGIKVAVKAYAPVRVGDKLALRHGNKGVVSRVLQDDQMPRTADGQPLEVIYNSLGLITRANPIQAVEAVLGKLARARGEAYKLPAFDSDTDAIRFVKDELQKYGKTASESVFDPVLNRTIPKVLTGEAYVMALHHTAAGKESSHGMGSYTAEGIPTAGEDDDNPKRIGLGEVGALVAHGVPNVIRNIKTVRGQANQDYWRSMMLGYPPPAPDIPQAYTRFLSVLRASGINVKEDGNKLHLLAMTDKDVDQLSGGEIVQPKTVKWFANFDRGLYGEESLDSIAGGLFDRGITGGHGGKKWSHIKLVEPLPNPAFEDPARYLLGLTKKQYEDVIAGKLEIPQVGTGTQAIREALARMPAEQTLKTLKDQYRAAATFTAKDALLKKIKYMQGLVDQGIEPVDLVITKVPVLPPIFRPIIATSQFQRESNPNLLYMDLMHANENAAKLRGQVDEGMTGEARLTLYNALKAVTGLGDPIKPVRVKQNVHGLLDELFGRGGPKTSAFQRYLIGGTVDLSGRAVISPDPKLGMDQIGIPENMAWTLYEPHVVRRLARKMGDTPESRFRSVKAVADRDAQAKRALLEEMAARPVLSSRAPVLHKFGIMGFEPVLVAGNTLRLPPQVLPGFAGDYDGNCVDFDTEIELYITPDILAASAANRGAWENLVMRLTGESLQQVVGQDGVAISVKIGEVPRVGKPTVTSRGQHVYAVPTGVYVASYDHEKGGAVLASVSAITLDERHPCVEVVTVRGRRVVVSDNESLCVFDCVAGGLAKRKPAEAIGCLAPYLKKDPILGTRFDFDTGWWYGALVADGWISGGRTVGYSKNCNARRARFVKLARKVVDEEFTAHEYHSEKVVGKYARSAKVHLNGKSFTGRVYSVAVVDHVARGRGRQALYKRIPTELLYQGSRDCLLGVLSGLLDGDSTLGWNTAIGSRRFVVKFNTSSPHLVSSLQVLLRKLGVRSSVTVNPARGAASESYTVCPSVVDMHSILRECRLTGEQERAAVEAFVSGPAPRSDNIDVVPVRVATMRAAMTALRARRKTALYAACSKAVRSGHLGRSTALRVCELLSGDSSVDGIAELQRVATSVGVHWERIETVRRVSRRDVFDLQVPDTLVFALANGLVVYDTMNLHVLVDEKDAQEVRTRMFPSASIRSPADFKTLYAPRQEYLYGLNAASTAKSDRPIRTFKTGKDALAAFTRGELDLGDRIVIAEE